jgi:hypothetical protein
LFIIAPPILAKLNGVNILEHKARLFKRDRVFRQVCGGFDVVPLKLIVFHELMITISQSGAQGNNDTLRRTTVQFNRNGGGSPGIGGGGISSGGSSTGGASSGGAISGVSSGGRIGGGPGGAGGWEGGWPPRITRPKNPFRRAGAGTSRAEP